MAVTYLELGELSTVAYEEDPGDKDAEAARAYLILNGWSEIGSSAALDLTDASQFVGDGYYAEVWQNAAGDIVITNEGTVVTKLTTLLADLKIAVGATPQAEIDAATFAKFYAKTYNVTSIIETGHSLGGAEAQVAMAALVDSGTSAGAVTFNAPGSRILQTSLRATRKVTASSTCMTKGMHYILRARSILARRRNRFLRDPIPSICFLVPPWPLPPVLWAYWGSWRRRFGTFSARRIVSTR